MNFQKIINYCIVLLIVYVMLVVFTSFALSQSHIHTHPWTYNFTNSTFINNSNWIIYRFIGFTCILRSVPLVYVDTICAIVWVRCEIRLIDLFVFACSLILSTFSFSLPQPFLTLSLSALRIQTETEADLEMHLETDCTFIVITS